MKVFLLIVLILSVVCAEKKSYNGYTVLRMQINSTNYDPITDIVEQYHLDVWQTNAIEQWMDIMIPPNQEVLDVISKHNHFVKIADVEEHIQNIDEYTFHNASLKRQVFFDYFPNWEQILEWLNTQVELHYDIASLFTVGHTYLGEPIIGIKIANGGPPKRSVILQSGIHAREWITVTSALYTIQELLNSPPVLNQLDFYIVPVFNIDGYSYTHSNERLWRKSREPNTGSTCIGTDLNRNYAYQWGGSGASASPCAETYRGAYADSSPELTDMTEWMSTIPNPLFYLDIHCCGAMFMSAWGYTYTLPPTQEYAQMMAAMEVARSSLRIAPNNNNYAIGSIANVIYIASGNSVDYTYTKFNLPTSFTIEVAGAGGFVRPITDILPYGREIYSGIYGVSAYLVSTLNK